MNALVLEVIFSIVAVVAVIYGGPLVIGFVMLAAVVGVNFFRSCFGLRPVEMFKDILKPDSINSKRDGKENSIIPFLSLSFTFAGFIGWIANIVQIIHIWHGPVTGYFVIKCIGVLFAPLGALLGSLELIGII